jgi:hypothetical protein
MSDNGSLNVKNQAGNGGGAEKCSRGSRSDKSRARVCLMDAVP